MPWFPPIVLQETKAHFCAERDWNRGQKLLQQNEEGYLLIKPNDPTKFLVNGEEQTKVGRQYVCFNKKCLKEYLHRKYNVQVEEFLYDCITIIDRETLKRLREEECACLSSNGLHSQWSLYFSFVCFKYPKLRKNRVLNRQKRLLNFVQTNKLKEQNFHEITLFEPWHNIYM